jgi:hypothetical protein
MKQFTKKNILALTAGAFILAGATSPFIAHASELHPFNRPAWGYHQVAPDKIAQNIAETFGVNKNEVLAYEKKGVHFRDLMKAAFIAKAGETSFDKVMQAKTFTNSWRDVAKSLGVTREKMRAAHQDVLAARMQEKLDISKQVSLNLLQQGYHLQDIAVASELAQNTGNPTNDILAMKKINNTWYTVAESLGVSKPAFRQDMKKLHTAFPFFDHHFGHRFGFEHSKSLEQ